MHLDEDDGGPGDCAVDAADEVPGDVLAIRVQVLCEVVLVYLGGAVPSTSLLLSHCHAFLHNRRFLQ